MCEKYTAFFINNYIQTETQIFFDRNNEIYMSPMIVNDIIIENDGFCDLIIFGIENYKKEQLKIFDYDMTENGDYVLKNYNLKTLIPINIIDKNTANNICENIIIENNNGIKKIKLLDYEVIVKYNDWVEAFNDLQRKFKENYRVKICAFCKKSSWNPYGGADFFNLLCFKNFTEEYNQLNIKDKMNIGNLMNKNKGKFNFVYLISSCNEYVENNGIRAYST
jgi:hypothetical protein